MRSQALEALRKIEVTPVFTAPDPTELRVEPCSASGATSRAFLRISIVCLSLSSDAQGVGEGKSAPEITALWQTDEVRLTNPSVTDEIRMGLDPYPMTLFDTLHRSLMPSWLILSARSMGSKLRERELPCVLSFGSWVGGDRDGNPFVTAECTREQLCKWPAT